MKKLTLLLAGLLSLSTASKADEGMWTLYNLPEAVYTQMVDYGFSLPCDFPLSKLPVIGKRFKK